MLAEVAEPPPVVTVILPLVAPVGIVNFSEVEVAPADSVTGFDPMVTVAPVRLVPLTVTSVRPFLPVVGVKDVTVGVGGVTVNEDV